MSAFFMPGDRVRYTRDSFRAGVIGTLTAVGFGFVKVKPDGYAPGADGWDEEKYIEHIADSTPAPRLLRKGDRVRIRECVGDYTIEGTMGTVLHNVDKVGGNVYIHPDVYPGGRTITLKEVDVEYVPPAVPSRIWRDVPPAVPSRIWREGDRVRIRTCADGKLKGTMATVVFDVTSEGPMATLVLHPDTWSYDDTMSISASLVDFVADATPMRFKVGDNVMNDSGERVTVDQVRIVDRCYRVKNPGGWDEWLRESDLTPEDDDEDIIITAMKPKAAAAAAAAAASLPHFKVGDKIVHLNGTKGTVREYLAASGEYQVMNSRGYFEWFHHSNVRLDDTEMKPPRSSRIGDEVSFDGASCTIVDYRPTDDAYMVEYPGGPREWVKACSLKSVPRVATEAAAAASSSAAAAVPSPLPPTPAEIARYCEWKRNGRACRTISALPPAPVLHVDDGAPHCPHCLRILRISRPAKLYACVLCERKWDMDRAHFPTALFGLHESVRAHPIAAAAVSLVLGQSTLLDRTTPPSYEEAIVDPPPTKKQKPPTGKKAKKRKSEEEDDDGAAAANKSQRS